MRSGLCNCLAFYDWERDISPSRFHEIAREVFAVNGVWPDVASNTNDENDLQTYASVVAELPSSRNGLDFYHTVPGFKQIIFGWDVFTSLNTSRGKTMVFCFAQNLANLDLEYFETTMTAIASKVGLTYGIGYQRSFDLGPDLYAYGVISGLDYSPKGVAEADRIGAWMRERIGKNRHLQGYLRDVYPLNILSSRHLAREVESTPLAQWINASADRGSVEQLSSEAWLWKVPESCLPVVRAELGRAGCTIVPFDPSDS